MQEEYIGKVKLNYTYYNPKFVYNEGDEEENLVLETVKRSTDYREHEKVIASDTRWPILYQLSKQRENIIEPMDIKKTDIVLEIGAGMGAVTGAIARKAQKVECIELSKRRSLANAYRNREYDNIEIYVGNFQDIQLENKYDVITLIGVFEYAQHYITSENPYTDFLTRIGNMLKKDGKLYIAIENKLGLKYFAGCVEDHLGRPFVGIEGYKKEDGVCTFSKSQLESMLNQTGFNNLYFYYPYPDYKLPVEIYSDDYLPGEDSQFPTIVNYDADRLCLFDEKKVYCSLSGCEELKMLANSFLIEAVKK
nr:class I SAM-dependent methyltransferase [uncultured Blautia sp.]